MTERFELAYENGKWWAVRDGDLTLWKEEVVQELNNLDKENKKLRSVNQELRNELKISETDYKAFNEVIKYADDLIYGNLSEHYQRKWKKVKELFE